MDHDVMKTYANLIRQPITVYLLPQIDVSYISTHKNQHNKHASHTYKYTHYKKRLSHIADVRPHKTGG